MILDGEERELAVAHPFDRPIVEVQMVDFKAARPGNAIRIANHREAMVLRGDEDLTRADVAHGMVTAAMPIGKLRGVAPEGEADELMPQADTERGK